MRPNKGLSWWSQQAITECTTTSLQSLEDAEEPVINQMVTRRLTPEDLALWEDGRYHFVTPHQSILFGLEMPVDDPKPKHPPWIPIYDLILWNTMVIVERAGLVAGLNGTTANEVLIWIASLNHKVGPYLDKIDANELQCKMAYLLYVNKCVETLAKPLRRSLPKLYLKPLIGGNEPETPTMVYKMMTDIVRREPQIKVGRLSIRH